MLVIVVVIFYICVICIWFRATAMRADRIVVVVRFKPYAAAHPPDVATAGEEEEEEVGRALAAVTAGLRRRQHSAAKATAVAPTWICDWSFNQSNLAKWNGMAIQLHQLLLLLLVRLHADARCPAAAFAAYPAADARRPAAAVATADDYADDANKFIKTE